MRKMKRISLKRVYRTCLKGMPIPSPMITITIITTPLSAMLVPIRRVVRLWPQLTMLLLLLLLLLRRVRIRWRIVVRNAVIVRSINSRPCSCRVLLLLLGLQRLVLLLIAIGILVVMIVRCEHIITTSYVGRVCTSQMGGATIIIIVGHLIIW